MKTCTKCGETKPIEDYHRNKKSLDGHLTFCKACRQVQGCKDRARNPDIYREQMRRHSKASYKRNAASHAQKRRDYYNKFPEKKKAHRAVSYALESGKLKRLSCEVCGKEKAHAHHENYSKPLDVIWLCSVHHSEIHKVGAEKLLGGCQPV